MTVDPTREIAMDLYREALARNARGAAVAIMRRNGSDAMGNGDLVDWAKVAVQLEALVDDAIAKESAVEIDEDETLELDETALEFEAFELAP